MTIACYCRVSPAGPSELIQRTTIQNWITNEQSRLSNALWFTDRGDSLVEMKQILVDAENKVVDTVVVYSFDRFAKTPQEGAKILANLFELNIRVVATAQNISIGGATKITNEEVAKLVLAVIEMESELRREKQRIGIIAAKEKGVFKGRKRGALKIEAGPQKAILLHKQGLSNEDIARALGLHRLTVVRYLKTAAKTKA